MTQIPAITLLTRKRGNALRRAETAGRALERLEGTKEYRNVLMRRNNYLGTVAKLTLAIEAVRSVEGKEVKVLGGLAT